MKKLIYLVVATSILACAPSNTKPPPTSCSSSNPQLLCIDGYGLIPITSVWGYDDFGRFYIDVATDPNTRRFSTRFICDSYIQDSIPVVCSYMANDENQLAHPSSAWFTTANGEYFKEVQYQDYDVRVDTSQVNNFNIVAYNSSSKELSFTYTGYFKQELVATPSIVFYVDIVLNNVSFKP